MADGKLPEGVDGTETTVSGRYILTGKTGDAETVVVGRYVLTGRPDYIRRRNPVNIF